MLALNIKTVFRVLFIVHQRGYNRLTKEKGERKMKDFVITYTLDFCKTTKTLTVTALNYTKAYVMALVVLPDDVAILDAKEKPIVART